MKEVRIIFNKPIAQKNIRYFLIFSFFLILISQFSFGQEYKKVLYVNSYAITYSWGDSVSEGILNIFKTRPDIMVYAEHLDSKRFGTELYEPYFELYKKKFKKVDFDVVVVSDNNALDFIIKYGDILVPNIPVVFCGVNNPEDYPIENSRYYGIKEGVDLDKVNQLILKIMPNVNTLYFIVDSTSTSLVNLKYVQSLEEKYKDRVKFEYIIDIGLDSLHKLVPNLKNGGAIALHNIFTNKGMPVNSDIVLDKTAKISSVPVFMDSETSFGNGIIGGILNKGSAHGEETAKMALQFIDDPGFKPKERVVKAKDNYYFDYNVVDKYQIDPKLIPPNAIIINAPRNIFLENLKYFLASIFIILILLVIISVLVVNNKKRKKAELFANQKLDEIKIQNSRLEAVNERMNSMNSELEKMNENLVLTNIELDKARIKSEESDKLKSAFLANMSHEIRTPLNAIVGFSSLFMEKEIHEYDFRRITRLIETNSYQLLKLIDDILDISKSEVGELKIHYGPVNLKILLSNIVYNFFPNKEQNKVKILVLPELQNKDLLLETDAVRLQQVFNNLVSNAIKFTDEGVVEIGYKINKVENKIIFWVKDTGVGIAQENLDKVFDRFWKTENKGIGFNPGTGLGLSISKKLCELMGGRIWVESELNVGSTFFFSHPMRTSSEHVFTEVKLLHKDGKGIELNIKVAIAEDNPNNMELLKTIMRKYNIETIEFSNGSDIASYFSEMESTDVDVVLMDIKMPVMDGYEATRIIKKHHPNLPVIAQTAHALRDEIEQIKKTGFDYVLTKPIDRNKLMDIVYNICNQVNR